MSRSKLENDREIFANQFQQDLKERVAQLQPALMDYLSRWLGDRLKTNSEGKITFSVSNNALLEKIPNRVKKFFTFGAGKRLLDWVIESLKKIGVLNDKYFRSFLEYPKRLSERVNRNIMRSLGFDTKRGVIIKDGYLYNLFASSSTASSTARDIQSSISAGESIKEFKDKFRSNFLTQGYLLRHFNTFARDLFMSTDRTFQNIQGEELNLTHCSYAGTIKNNTRCFCEKRVNLIYTREEVNSWNQETWKGKNTNVNVLQAAGGYNCRHHFSWMSEKLAIREAKRRGIEINQYHNVSCNQQTS